VGIVPRRGHQVGRAAVGLHHDPVAVVDKVAVLVPAAAPYPDLPAGPGQAVRALDITQVAKLEQGARPSRDVGQRRGQARTEGHLRPLGHGRLDPGRGGQPARARGRQPAQRVVEAQRLRGQIKSSLLDPRPRRLQHRMPRLSEPR
jgi:hypothetical protein